MINLLFDDRQSGEKHENTAKVDYSRRFNLSDEERAQRYRQEDDELRHTFANSEQADEIHIRFQMRNAGLRREIAKEVQEVLKQPRPYWG